MQEVLFYLPKNLFSSYSNFQQKASRDSKNINWSGIDINKSENDSKKENINCEYIIQKIETLQKSGIECKDIAILVRNNNEIQFISEEINKYKNSSEANHNYNYDITASSSSNLSNSISIYIIINILKSLIEQDDFLKIELAYIYNYHILSKDIQDLIRIDNESNTCRRCPGWLRRYRQSDQILRHARWHGSIDLRGHRQGRFRNAHRAQQVQRIIRTEVRGLCRLPFGIHIDHNRSRAGAQHHMSDRPVHTARCSNALPGQNDQQRQHKRQNFVQNGFHPVPDIGQRQNGLQAQSDTPEAQGREDNVSGPVPDA